MSLRKFNLPAYPTVHFSDKIWVHCPNCHDAALVTFNLPKYSFPVPSGLGSTCVCSSCGFQQKNNDKWNGYVQGFINRSCGFCGNRVIHSTKPTKTCSKTLKATCNTCTKEREYETTWYRYRVNKPNDPYFGYNLWLQTTVKSNILWLYNLQHLNYLRTYVEAKLREDDSRHKYSMITNLPQWIKSSKNRDIILKKLDKLENKLKRNAR